HSDVYSLGAILYELLTGRPPFRGPNAVATLQAVMGSEAVAPRTLNPDVPPDAETICLKCLEKAPERRYHSARELAEDLDRFLKQEPVLARPAGVVRKTLSWMRSRPQTLIGVAALAIVALGFFTFQLIEENAFLRAQHLDPTLTRQPGSLSGALPIWNTIAGFLGVGGLLANLWIQSRGAGSWRAVFDPVKNLRPPKAVSRPVMFTALGMGLVCVTFGVVFLGKIIQTNVWEGDSPSNYYLGVYAVVWFGLTALWQVARVYQRSTFGAPPRDLTVEQIAEVRRAVNESDLVGAIKLYRRAVPDANFSEANEFVADLAAEVERAEPGKKIAPSLALKDMNWRLAALCAAIEAVLLGAYVSAWPPAHPLGFAIGVSGFYLFGAGIMIGTRLQGFWKRALLVVPAVILAAVGHELTPEIPTLSDLALLPYLGMAAGCAVVVSAFTKPGATRADDARLSDEQP
ncbi:MAG TPA: hypothetical protein VGE52_07850, partial [Pirellulales bacterium]